MINVKYKYRNKEGSIKFEFQEKIRDACLTVANQLDIDIDTIVVILNEEKLNVKSKKTFEDIKNLYKLTKDEVEMIFYNDPEKIVKIVIDYEGDTREIKAKKEEDSLFNIFGKLKLNMQKIFLVGGGEAIQEEDLQKSFKELNKIEENDEGEIKLLAYNREDSFGLNDDINNNNIDNNDKTNNNTNDSNSNEKILNNNNNLNEKILDKINPNDKILDTNNPNDKILNSNNTDDKILNSNNTNDKILDVKDDKEKEKVKKIRYVSVKSNKLFLTKTFLTLKIEFFLIMAFTWLGCYFNINEAFIKSIGTMLGTFIPTIIFLFFISISLFSVLILKSDEEEEEKERKKYKKKKILIICILLYILFITFYCFLLTNFTQYKYIMMVLFLIIIDFLLLEIYHSYIETNEYFFLAYLPLIIVNILLIVIYRSIWIERTRVIVNISIISFVIILYIVAINYKMRKFEEEEYVFGACILSYGVFALGAFLIVIIFLILFLIIIHCCYEKCYLDNHCCDCCDCCDCSDY